MKNNRFKNKNGWLKTNGLKFAEKAMGIAQEAVVYAGLSTDPHTATIAIQEMNKPSIEHLQEANEINERNSRKQSDSQSAKKMAGTSSNPPEKNAQKKPNRFKTSATNKPDAKKIKTENKKVELMKKQQDTKLHKKIKR